MLNSKYCKYANGLASGSIILAIYKSIFGVMYKGLLEIVYSELVVPKRCGYNSGKLEPSCSVMMYLGCKFSCTPLNVSKKVSVFDNYYNEYMHL